MAFRPDCAIIGACGSNGQKSERMTGMEQMKRVRTTLKDIANACGYSVNTVSRALRGDKRLSKATRSLIQETARSMDYIPNTMASSLRSGRSRMIAVIVNDLHNQHFCDLLNRMDRDLRDQNYNLMILCMQLEDELAEKLIHTAISQFAGGYFLEPTRVTTLQDNLNSLIPGFVPLLLTLLCMRLLKKNVSPIVIILCLFLVGILGHVIGLL